MTLAERLGELVRAAFSGIYVRTHEPHDAIREVAGLCRREGWSLAARDVDRGLSLVARSADAATAAQAADPLAAVRSLCALATPDGTSVLVLVHFHRFLGSAEVVQALDTQLQRGKQARTFVVILAPVVQVPVELERQFVLVDHDLPGRDQLEAIARSIATEPGELPEGDALGAVLDAAAGLTRVEAENALSLALVRHGRLEPGALWELKTAALKKSGPLDLHRGGEGFAGLGGLGALKSFRSRAPRPRRRPRPRRAPAGAARLGQERLPQGVGRRDRTPHTRTGRRGVDGGARGPDRTEGARGPARHRRHASPSSARSRRPSAAPPRARATRACRPASSARSCPG